MDDVSSRWDLTVGIQPGVPHPNGEQPDGSQLTVAEIGAKHEFGLEVPMRSWLRGFCDERQNAIKSEIRQTLKAIMAGADEAKSMQALALRLASMCRDRIDEGIGPPLSPQTVQAKGSSLQLVETGILRASIDGEATRKA